MSVDVRVSTLSSLDSRRRNWRRWPLLTSDARTWRSYLRLSSGLVLLSFVICHLTAHAFLLVSFDTADVAFDITMTAWRTWPGTALLLTAFLVHYANALWSIYIRRTLRLPPWQWAQLALGLSIPLLLMIHVIGTRVADIFFDVNAIYQSVLISHWVAAPWHGVLQVTALLTVWTHACIGIHFWLRTKTWYAGWRPYLFAFALLLPTLALAGYVSAGNETIRRSADPTYIPKVMQTARITPQKVSDVARLQRIGLVVHIVLVTLAFAARGMRSWRHRRRPLPRLAHASGRVMPIRDGASVLETLRENGIPHASLCGGRARCTTCRVMVTNGYDHLPAPSGLEAEALARIGASPGMRLACQIRPRADIAVMPLLAADAGAADGALRGGFEGSERLVTVVFVDIRGSTSLGEVRLPYDVLFILNRFFREMSAAITATSGHYSQFTGDGLMALYGLDAADPTTGPASALSGAREMLLRLDQLNHELRAELWAPLRIGLGVHYGEAIVGAMGPPRSQIITAIGDTVNTCARLESLTKEFDCVAIVSRRAAEVADLNLAGRTLQEAVVKGRSEPVQFYALKSMADLRLLVPA
jgi:adenylate cyclase